MHISEYVATFVRNNKKMFGFFKKAEKTIEDYEVRKMLFENGWERNSTFESEFRGYYSFYKGCYSIYSNIGHKKYVLSNNKQIIKEYSKMITEKEVIDAISLAK